MLTFRQVAEIAHKINPSVVNVVLQQQVWDGGLCINFYNGSVHYNESLLNLDEDDEPPFYHWGWREDDGSKYLGCWHMVEGYVDLSEYPKSEDNVYDFSAAIISFEKEEPTLHSLEEIADYVAPLFRKARYFYYNKHWTEGTFLVINSEKMLYDGTELIEGIPFGWYDSSYHSVASIIIDDLKNLEQYNGDYSKAEVIRDNGERTKKEVDENNFINTASSLFMNAIISGDYFIKK